MDNLLLLECRIKFELEESLIVLIDLLDNDCVTYRHLIDKWWAVLTVTHVRITVCHDRRVIWCLYTYPKEGQQAENVWEILPGNLLERSCAILKSLPLLHSLKLILLYQGCLSSFRLQGQTAANGQLNNSRNALLVLLMALEAANPRWSRQRFRCLVRACFLVYGHPSSHCVLCDSGDKGALWGSFLWALIPFTWAHDLITPKEPTPKPHRSGN